MPAESEAISTGQVHCEHASMNSIAGINHGRYGDFQWNCNADIYQICETTLSS